MVWPWGLFASLAIFELTLLGACVRLGAARVDTWLFRHRDRLPIPFLVVGIVTRLLAREAGDGAPRDWMLPLGMSLIILGEALRVWSVGIVGAATRSASTNARRLVQEGPYAIIRNPIYAGNLLLCLGIACFTDSGAVVLACAAYFLILYRRIIRAEERFLRATFGASYDAFCRRIPRLLPWRGIAWSSLRAPFAIGELRKEPQTILGIVCAVIVVQLVVRLPWDRWIPRPLIPSAAHPQAPDGSSLQ